MKKVHLMNFHIAGFSYWDGCEAFENLKIGTKLTFSSVRSIVLLFEG